MIYGIGTDIVKIDRLGKFYERHGRHGAERLLSANELTSFDLAKDKERFLAKRFAAKEAFAKAMGTGIRGVISFANIEITHNELGKPEFAYHAGLANQVADLGLNAHLSISDEHDYAMAYVVIEKTKIA